MVDLVAGDAMNVQGLGCDPPQEPRSFNGLRPAIQITIAEMAGTGFVHLVLDGRAILLDQNHATALARLLDASVCEISARAIGR